MWWKLVGRFEDYTQDKEQRMTDITLLLLLCTIATTALYWIWVLRSNGNQPPTLPGFIPFIGHSYKFLTNNSGAVKYFNEIAQFCYKNEGVAIIWFGTQPTYAIADSEVSSLVCKDCVEKTHLLYKVGRPILGHGLITAPVSLWKRHRKILNQAFNQQMLDEYTIVFNKQARRLVKGLAKEVGTGPFDQMKYAKKIALETICLTTMGLDLTDTLEDNLFVESCDYLSNVVFERYTKVWLHNNFMFNLSNLKKTQDRCLKIVHDTTKTVLKRKREDKILEARPDKDIKQLSGIRRRTYIDILLECNAFSDEEIEDEVNTIIVAGSDTTAASVTTILAVIASFPDVQDRIVAEIQRELKYSYENITRSDLSRLHYLDAVIKEVLRFHTVIGFTFRHLDKDIKTEHYTLKAGADCLMILDAIHKHPSWGPDLHDFRPERWLDPTTVPETSSAAFGFGKRNCIGKSYSMTILKVMLFYVLQNYQIKRNNANIKFDLGVVFKPVSEYQISIEHRVT